MSDDVKLALAKLEAALKTLQEGVQIAQTPLHRDGVIQRFEYTFELLWKTIKIIIEYKGLYCKSAKESFQEAFRAGWITDEATLLDMQDDRNKSSHIYSQIEADRIFEKIRSVYTVRITQIFEKLKKENK